MTRFSTLKPLYRPPAEDTRAAYALLDEACQEGVDVVLDVLAEMPWWTVSALVFHRRVLGRDAGKSASM